MKNHSLQPVSISTFLVPTLLAVILLGTIFLPSSDASGQSIDEGWSPPINLSQSGGAGSPIMFVDAAGTAHVFWLDEYAGYFYRSGDGETWGPRTRVDPPFDPYHPTLILGGNNRVHALWIDEDNDLYWSRAVADELSRSEWVTPYLMAGSVVDFSVEVDAQNGIHVSYIYNEDEEGLAAGVGYLSSSDNGTSWSEPASLFQSPYMRSLLQTNADIEMASARVGDGNWIYVVWGNPVRKQVFLIRSLNGGTTWDEPIILDGPEYGTGGIIPYNITIASSAERAIAVWKRGQPGAACTLHYSWTDDGGNTWSERLRMLGEFQGCPTSVTFIRDDEQIFLLQINYSDRVYLLVWNGEEWSDPQLQSSLIEFEDPETYNLVNLSCFEFALLPEHNKIFMVGCDLATGADIWFMVRDFGDSSTWFPPTPLWKPPELISHGEREYGTPVILAGPSDYLHVFWSQPDNIAAINNPDKAIYYMRWDGGSWTHPSRVISSPEGNVHYLSATIDANDRLLLVWSGGDSGQIFFSWASAFQATHPSDWTSPEALPSPVPSGSKPAIHALNDRSIYVTYSVPLNEARGIYITRSNDGGISWSDPMLVFDAVTARWDSVNDVKINTVEGRLIQILFTRYTLPEGSGPLSLYYSRSEDGGNSWSLPELISEHPVHWSSIVNIGDGSFMRIWQENNNGFLLRYQKSVNGGSTWSSGEIVSNLSDFGPTSLAESTSGYPHLVQSSQDLAGFQEIKYWVWDGEGWLPDKGLNLGADSGSGISNISATVNDAAQLNVVYSGPILRTQVDLLEERIPDSQYQEYLAVTSRILPIIAAIIPPSTTSPPLTSQVVPTLTPTSEVATDNLVENGVIVQEPPPPRESNGVMGLVLGAGLAVMLVTFVSVKAARNSRRR